MYKNLSCGRVDRTEAIISLLPKKARPLKGDFSRKTLDLSAAWSSISPNLFFIFLGREEAVEGHLPQHLNSRIESIFLGSQSAAVL
jgi:hypothetical protein